MSTRNNKKLGKGWKKYKNKKGVVYYMNSKGKLRYDNPNKPESKKPTNSSSRSKSNSPILIPQKVEVNNNLKWVTETPISSAVTETPQSIQIPKLSKKKSKSILSKDICTTIKIKKCAKKNKICNKITGRCNNKVKKKLSKLKTGERCTETKKKICKDKGKICNEKTGRCNMKSLKQNTHILSISPLHNVNVDEEDFYTNICVLLKNLAKHKQIYNEKEGKNLWTYDALIDLDHILPTLRNNKPPPNNKIILNFIKLKNINTAYLGKKNLVLGSRIGGGSYGEIYSGHLEGKLCAIKISKNQSSTIKSRIEYHAENIIHSELFCNTDKKLPSGSALIPKPSFMCKYSISKDKYSYMFGMQSLTGNLYHFIKNAHIKLTKTTPNEKTKFINNFTKTMLKMMRGICLLLYHLQKNYNFYHRDMHGGNIMYKKTSNQYEWYLIDFGMSTMVLHNNQLNTGSVGAYSPYSDGAKGKDGHDIRLMILSIIDNHSNQLEKLLKPEFFKELSDLNMAILKQFDDNGVPYKKYNWHRGYRYAFRNVETLITEPKNFLEQIVKKYEKMYNF